MNRCRSSWRLIATFAGVALLAGCAVPFESRPKDPPSQSNGPASSVHLSLGVPRDSDPTDDILLDHRYFVVSYNPKLKGPNWVAWRLVAADLRGREGQKTFHADEELADGLYRVRPRDYLEPEFHRGHLCPSADRTADPFANRATYVMTNIHPQRPALNLGPWKGLEEHSRRHASQGSVLFIVAGGRFTSPPRTIGPAIAVPAASYKLIVIADSLATVGPSTEVIAVSLPNNDQVRGKKWEDFRTSIDEVEAATGYDFLTSVPKDVQDVIESRRRAAPGNHRWPAGDRRPSPAKARERPGRLDAAGPRGG